MFGIDDAIIGGALAGGGSLLGGLFGGRDNAGSEYIRNSNVWSVAQANALKDAFFGSNWRKAANASAYGPEGSRQSVWGEQGMHSSDPMSQFNYSRRDGTSGMSPGALARAAGGSGGYSSAPAGVGNPELYGGNTPYGTLPILQQIEQASQSGLDSDQAELGRFDRETNDIDRLGESQYKEAARYGTGQEKVIRGDAAKALTGANRLSIARATSMGLGGSTTTLDELGANSAGNFREMERALANNAQAASGMKIQARQNQTSNKLQRSGQRESLYTTTADRANQFRMAPINATLGVLGSSTANPNYASAGGAPQSQPSLGASLGNTASSLGGLFLAKGLFGGAQTPGSTSAASSSALGNGGQGFSTAPNYNAMYNPYGGGYSSSLFSDRRLKKVLQKIGGTKAGRPALYLFEYTKAAIKAGRGAPGKWVGYMAQDLAKLDARLVRRDKGGFLLSTIPSVRIA